MSEWTNLWKSTIFIKWENELAKKKQKKKNKQNCRVTLAIYCYHDVNIRAQYNKNIKPYIAAINTTQTHP